MECICYHSIRILAPDCTCHPLGLDEQTVGAETLSFLGLAWRSPSFLPQGKGRALLGMYRLPPGLLCQGSLPAR